MRVLRRVLVSAIALLALVTILVHIPMIQRRVGACPFGYDKPRAAATARAHTTGPLAPARPALGFTLSSTTSGDILAWAQRNNIKCERHHIQLECFDARLAEHGATLATTTTWFELDDRDTITAIKTVRRANDATVISSAFAATESTLRGRLAAPSLERGTTAELALGAFRQAMVEHVYADYRAQIRATNMGNGGYILTESYAAL